MPPLPKTCPKMVPSHKGGSFSVKDVFAKKFLAPEEIPLAARSHRFFGNTLLKAGHLTRWSALRHFDVGADRKLGRLPQSRGDRLGPPDRRADEALTLGSAVSSSYSTTFCATAADC